MHPRYICRLPYVSFLQKNFQPNFLVSVPVLACGPMTHLAQGAK